MDHTYVDEKNLKSLEDLAVVLVTGILTLQTLHNLQVKAIDLGIMPDEMATRTNTILWDLRRLMKLYQEQTENVLELVPDDFNAEAIINGLKKRELTKARQMIRKKNAKDNTTDA